MNVPPDMRDSEEYKAAWDLEVWKAEEKRKFLKVVERERVELFKQWEEEAARRERERVDAFERQKSQVVALGQRVGRTLEVLQEREEKVTEKEAELNRKKSTLVVEHEAKVRETEDKLRHANEVQYFNLESLKSQNNELLIENQALRSQVAALQADFNKLTSDFTEYKKQVLLPPDPVTSLSASVEEVKSLRVEKTTLERDLAKARGTITRHKTQIKKIASEYNNLLKVTHMAQMEAMENERNTLRRAQAIHEATALRQFNRDTARKKEMTFTTSLDFAVPKGKGYKLVASSLADGVNELKDLLEEAEAAERQVITVETNNKRKMKKTPNPDPDPDPDDDSMSTPPSPPVSMSTFSLPPDALTSLKKELANRARLLSSGVMDETDDYIMQLTASIEARCKEYGVSPSDLS